MKDVDMEGAMRHLDAVLAAAKAAQEEAAREAAQEESRLDPGDLDWSVVEGWLTEANTPDNPGGGERVPPRRRMRELVQEHRRDGVGPRAVWQQLREEGYTTAEQTVISWMRADTAAGILAQPGGKGSPYVPGPRFTLEQPGG